MTYITLQFVGLLGVLNIELFRVTGVVVQLLAIHYVTGLGLALLSQQEFGLVRVDFEL